jgi:hypothetical protein
VLILRLRSLHALQLSQCRLERRLRLLLAFEMRAICLATIVHLIKPMGGGGWGST